MPRNDSAEQYYINRSRASNASRSEANRFGNIAYKQVMNQPYRSGTTVPRGNNGPDPMELFLRTQQELNAISGYNNNGSSGRSSGGSSRRGGGGGYSRGGGGGGGGGGGASAAYTGQLAGVDESLRQLALYYGQQQGSLGGFAEAARQRAIQENAVLAGQIANSNKATEGALAQRTAAINSILAGAGQTSQMFDAGARRDLQGQGIGTAGYDQAYGLEQGRMASFQDAQRLYGADLDSLARAGNASRTAFAGQSQRDALSNITATEQMMLSKLAQQRVQSEAELVRQRAQIRAEAAAAGVKI